MRSGAIAMLDILGWKGIWQRKSPDQVIAELQDIETSVRHFWEQMEKNPKFVGHQRFKSVDLHVQTMSDTVFIHAEGSPHPTIELVAGLSGTAICTGVQHGLLIRGALSYGQFCRTDAIFVGPAVDEAASWYEQTEMIGVCLTPHAEMTVRRHSLTLDRLLRKATVQVKGAGAKEMLCVDWPRLLIEHKEANHPEAYLMDALQDVVMTPSIALKADWGLRFAGE